MSTYLLEVRAPSPSVRRLQNSRSPSRDDEEENRFQIYVVRRQAAEQKNLEKNNSTSSSSDIIDAIQGVQLRLTSMDDRLSRLEAKPAASPAEQERRHSVKSAEHLGTNPTRVAIRAMKPNASEKTEKP